MDLSAVAIIGPALLLYWEPLFLAPQVKIGGFAEAAWPNRKYS